MPNTQVNLNLLALTGRRLRRHLVEGRPVSAAPLCIEPELRHLNAPEGYTAADIPIAFHRPGQSTASSTS